MAQSGERNNLQSNGGEPSVPKTQEERLEAQRAWVKNERRFLNYEYTVNSQLAIRVTSLLSELGELDPESVQNPDIIVVRKVMKVAPENTPEDRTPTVPPGLDPECRPLTTYSQMMASLVDSVTEALEEKGVAQAGRFNAFIEEFQERLEKLEELRDDSVVKLNELALRAPPENINVSTNGSSSSSGQNSQSSSTASASSSTTGAPTSTNDNSRSSGSGGAGQEANPESAEQQLPLGSEAAQAFARIPTSDLSASQDFMSVNPEIIQSAEADGILVGALVGAVNNAEKSTIWQQVHQAALLDWRFKLGPQQFAQYLARLNDPTQRAKEAFHNDINHKVNRLQQAAAQHRAGGGTTADLPHEQMLETFKNPPITVHLQVPDPRRQDREGRAARSIFESLDPPVKEALESRSMDNLQRVLSTMPQDKVRAVIGRLEQARCFVGVQG